MNDTADQSTLLNVQGEQAWTKEPWEIRTEYRSVELESSIYAWMIKGLNSAGLLCSIFGVKAIVGDFDRPTQEANASRIISAINATAGIADPLLAITKARQALAGAVTWHQGDPYRNGCETERKAWREQMALLDEAIKALGVKL